MVAGRAGGIPMQFPPAYEHYLVDSVAGCAHAVADLLEHPGVRADFGREGREHMRQHFLLPHLVCNELSLIQRIVGG